MFDPETFMSGTRVDGQMVCHGLYHAIYLHMVIFQQFYSANISLRCLCNVVTLEFLSPLKSQLTNYLLNLSTVIL